MTAVAALLCAALGFWAPAAAATHLDPFRPILAGSGAGSSAATGRRMDPFRPDRVQAQAEQAPAEESPAKAAPSGTSQSAPAEAAPTASPPITGTPAAAAPAQPEAPVACTTDEQCPTGTICEHGACTPVQPRTNIAYLYYHEGSFREVALLYWSKSGASGYRVLFPLLWQFWSPESRTTVVLNTSYSRQGDAWSFGFWPVLFASNRFGWAAPLLGTFHLVDPAARSSVGALALLYWWQRTPQSSFDLFFPLFARSSKPSTGFWWAAPLNFGWREGDTRSTLVFPLAYHRKSRNDEFFLSPVGYESRDPKGVRGSAAWVYWYGEDKTDDSSYEVLFPLLWSFRSPDRDTSVFGPFLHWRRGKHSVSGLFPIVWDSRDADKNEGWGTVFPLAFWWRSDGGRRAGFASPLGGYLRDDDEQRRTLVLLPGLIYSSHDRQMDVDVVTPLFVRVHDKLDNSYTHSAGLLWYDHTDASGGTKTLFPLFWRFHERSGATATAVLPFYANRSRPDDHSTAVGVFPVMAYWRKLANGWGGGLFPLAFLGRQGTRSHAVFPFFLTGHVSDAQGSTTVSPLFYRTHDATGGHTGLPPLLTFWGGRDGKSYTIQFPLLWHFADQQRGTSTTVTPVGFRHTAPDGWQAGIGPLLPIVWAGRSGTRSHEVLLPLYWHFRDDAQQSDSTVVLNVFHRKRGGETTDAFLPFFWWRRGIAPGGHEESSLTVFPFMHLRRSAESELMLTPVAAWTRTPERQFGFAGPVYWYDNPTWSVRGIPLLWADLKRKDTGVRTRQYGLLFMADDQNASRRLLLPFWGSYHDAHSDQTWVLPTFYRGRWDDGTSITAAPPLFWWSKTPTTQTRQILTWYDRATPTSASNGLVPLWFYGRNNDSKYLVMPPLLSAGSWSPEKAWWFTGPVVYARSGAESTAVGFPLWWQHTSPDRSWRVAFPLYWHWSSASEDSSTTYFTLAFWWRRGTRTTAGVLPLIWRSVDEKNGAGATGILPLFYSSHAPGESMFLTLLGGAGHTQTSRFWYALNVLSRRTPDKSFDMVFPLWFRSQDRPTGTSTTVIPPLLLYSRTSPERSLSTALALFWRRRDVASSTSVVLPLFYDVHEYHQSRTTVALPLFIRHRDDAEKSVTWLAPLWYSRRAPSESTTVLFPLLWDYRSPEHRTTLVLPFYVGVERPTYAATWVFPTYYYREGRGAETGTYRRAVFPLFETAVKRPGDYMWEVLLGVFGHERIGINRYWKVFFFTIQAETPKRSQTSWFSNPPRGASAVGTSSLGSW